ncbi:MAG TPA: hypothetical protein VFD64_11470 [Gemmatimonadaceae bacterium]|nr:hypothetical protein [Gemmatimonadaceae bacterium]
MTIKPIRSSSLAFIGALSVGSTLAANALLRGDSLPQATRVVVALVPLVFFFAFIWAELSWIRSQDEYHRAVLLESLAVAFPLAIAMAVVVESLQKAGLLASLTIGDVWPWMAVTWLPALWLARLRYK